jgi:hypothetical protein
MILTRYAAPEIHATSVLFGAILCNVSPATHIMPASRREESSTTDAGRQRERPPPRGSSVLTSDNWPYGAAVLGHRRAPDGVGSDR